MKPKTIKPFLIHFLVAVFFVFHPLKGHSQDNIRIACVGNSITYGAGIETREVNCYPAQLSLMLGKGYDVKNFGRNGATLLRKGDLPYWKTEEYKAALAFNPNLVFIKLGTNDTKPQNRIFLDSDCINDYKDLIESFTRLPSNPRVVLLVPVPVFKTDSITTGINSATLKEKIIPMVRQTAWETGCEIVNLYNLFIESPELFPDEVHPNAVGAKIMARRLYEYTRMKEVPSIGLAGKLTEEKTVLNFYGFEGYGFTFDGRAAKVVIPKKEVPGYPWVWRARFWGHEPQADIALLERGFHIVYCDVAELFGNDKALSIWDDYYQLLTGAGLSKKAVMEGMSRGGIYIYRWAAKYPERVAGIYADAPVLDLKSWPGGKGRGQGSPGDWETFKSDYGFTTEQEALDFKDNPLDLTEKIAKSGFPMLHVVGDTDDVVPVAENTSLFETKMKEAGGSINVIHKPGIGHHPHSLPNPQPIVDFVLKATDYLANQDLIPGSSALENFPQGKTPQEIGLRIAEKFLKTSHSLYGNTRPLQPPTQITYPDVCTWLGGMWFADVSQNEELEKYALVLWKITK